MNASEFADLKNKLGWTGKKLAKELGVGERTIWRWLSGETEIPLPVKIYLQCVLEVTDTEWMAHDDRR